jgi:Flp pilus assembly protein TadD
MTTSAPRGINAAADAARNYNDVRNYQRADEVLRMALAENPTDPTLLTEYARAQLGLENYAAAGHAAYGALSAAPDDERAMRIYAAALGGQNRIAEAVWMGWRTVCAHPNVDLAHYVYAIQLKKAGQLPDALAAVNEALRLRPADADFFVLRASILTQLGRSAQADADYREALRLQPDHPDALNNLAVHRLARGKLSAALRGFLGVGRLDPALGDLARQNIAVVLVRVLRWSAVLVAVMAVTLMLMTALHDEGHPTVATRVVAGLDAAALVAVVVWVLRRVPRRTIISVMRQRGVLALRAVLLGAAVLAGVLATSLGPVGPIAAAGPLLFLATFVTVIVGRLSGD